MSHKIQVRGDLEGKKEIVLKSLIIGLLFAVTTFVVASLWLPFLVSLILLFVCIFLYFYKIEEVEDDYIGVRLVKRAWRD